MLNMADIDVGNRRAFARKWKNYFDAFAFLCGVVGSAVLVAGAILALESEPTTVNKCNLAGSVILLIFTIAGTVAPLVIEWHFKPDRPTVANRTPDIGGLHPAQPPPSGSASNTQPPVTNRLTCEEEEEAEKKRQDRTFICANCANSFNIMDEPRVGFQCGHSVCGTCKKLPKCKGGKGAAGQSACQICISV